MSPFCFNSPFIKSSIPNFEISSLKLINFEKTAAPSNAFARSQGTS